MSSQLSNDAGWTTHQATTQHHTQATTQNHTHTCNNTTPYTSNNTTPYTSHSPTSYTSNNIATYKPQHNTGPFFLRLLTPPNSRKILYRSYPTSSLKPLSHPENLANLEITTSVPRKCSISVKSKPRDRNNNSANAHVVEIKPPI